MLNASSSHFDPQTTLADSRFCSAAISHHRISKQDSEQFRFVPRTLRPDSETLLLRPQEPFEPMGERRWILAGLVRIQGTTRAYSTSQRRCPRSGLCTAPPTSIRSMRRPPRATSRQSSTAAAFLSCTATRSGSPHDVGGRWSCGGRIAANPSMEPGIRVAVARCCAMVRGGWRVRLT
jgi:hypothetical protein